eukprot:GHVU01073747.1.p1 GENE.GHVU01073747.1~~GHVU01073747.1.p1  ORF type:complete len:212 (+),score=34.34 GHVU01073747.1:1-636(+)
MSTFDVEIEYRPGKLHGNADGLSRPPVSDHDCGARACVCTCASETIRKALEPFDGEPEMEVHPGIPPAVTAMIAVVTRSGRGTGSGSKPPERKEEEGTVTMGNERELPCGQPEQLVPDVPTDSEGETGSAGEGMTDLGSDTDETDAENPEPLLETEEEWTATDVGLGPDVGPDVPSSESDEEFFSDEEEESWLDSVPGDEGTPRPREENTV